MPTTLTFVTEDIPDFTQGVPQEFSLEASGGTPPYEFEITQGDLPEGLNFDTSGKISGTAETPGTFTPFFKLTDSAGDHLTQAMEVTVLSTETETHSSQLTFISEGIPDFTVGVFQEFTLEASGGTPPYEFEITQGDLPEGLNLDRSGTLSGTAETSGTFTPFFKLSDSTGDHVTEAMQVTATGRETANASA